MSKRRGQSYRKRVEEVNRIYDEHAKSGVSNREIWRRYIYPVYAISERTFYNILNASARLDIEHAADTCQMLLFKFDDYEQGSTDDNKADTEGHPGGDER